MYISGVTSDVPAVTLAGASAPAHAAQYMVTSAITSGSIGRIDNVGRISGLSTADLGAADGNVYLGSAATGLMASSTSGPLLITQRVAQVVTRDSGTGGVLEIMIGPAQRLGRDAIQLSAIQSNSIAAGHVVQRHVGDSAISAAHVQMSALSGLQIKASGVVSSRLAVDAVGQRHIGNSQISGAHLQVSAVAAAAIQSNAVTQPKIGDSAISAAHVQMSSLSGLQIAASGVVSSRIGIDAIGQRHISDSAISAAHVQMSSLSGLQIVASGVVSSRIGLGAIVERHIASNVISANKMVITADETIVGNATGSGLSRDCLPKVLAESFTAADFSAAANADTVGFAVSIPDQAVVQGAWFDLTTLWGNGATGSSLSNVHVDFGLSGAVTIDTDGFCNGYPIFSGVDAVGTKNPMSYPVPQVLFSGGPVYVTSNAQLPIITISATGVNMSNVSNGGLRAYVMYIEQPVGSAIT
ncbi:hypothetical protein HN371_29375 [Candidatus Poribacteria bacterium]|nr:hypothetical protein [Candidatus Poribacteria bacterium]